MLNRDLHDALEATKGELEFADMALYSQEPSGAVVETEVEHQVLRSPQATSAPREYVSLYKSPQPFQIVNIAHIDRDANRNSDEVCGLPTALCRERTAANGQNRNAAARVSISANNRKFS